MIGVIIVRHGAIVWGLAIDWDGAIVWNGAIVCGWSYSLWVEL